MSNWYEEVGGKFVKIKEGQSATLTIKGVKRVTDNHKFDPKNADLEPQGFHFEFETDKGILTVGTYVLQSKLANAQVDIGDTITINHPAKGKYEVTKLTEQKEEQEGMTPDKELPF